MAEREGFEPSIEFPLYTLSKRAPSTTRPSLRLAGSHQNNMRGARHSGMENAAPSHCRANPAALLYTSGGRRQAFILEFRWLRAAPLQHRKTDRTSTHQHQTCRFGCRIGSGAAGASSGHFSAEGRPERDEHVAEWIDTPRRCFQNPTLWHRRSQPSAHRSRQC